MIGEGDGGGGTDASRGTRNQRDFSSEFPVHDLKYRPRTEML